MASHGRASSLRVWGRRKEEREMMNTLYCTLLTILAVLVHLAAANIGLLSIPPVVIEHPTPHSYFLPTGSSGVNDDDIELRCYAEGSPPLHYTWYKDDSVIDNRTEHVSLITYSSTGSVLLLTPDSESAMGKYQCRVTNNVPGAVALSNVAVLEAAVFKRYSRRQPKTAVNIHKRIGDGLYIPCNHTISSPQAHYRWTTVICDPDPADPQMLLSRGCKRERPEYLPLADMSDGRITMFDDGGLFFAYLKKEDEGVNRVYKCIASDHLFTSKEYGGSYSRIIVDDYPERNQVPKCRVQSSPVTVLRGQDVTLKCFCEGRPTAEITWRRGDGKYLHANRTLTYVNELTIMEVTPADSGRYECVGRNDVGMDSDTVVLKVQSEPEFREVPESHNATVFSIMELRCLAWGIPKPNVTWYFNDQPAQESTTDIQWRQTRTALILQNVQLTHSMTIQCRIQNEHGSKIAGAYLNVIEYIPPPAPTTTTTTTKSTTTSTSPSTSTTSISSTSQSSTQSSTQDITNSSQSVFGKEIMKSVPPYKHENEVDPEYRQTAKADDLTGNRIMSEESSDDNYFLLQGLPYLSLLSVVLLALLLAAVICYRKKVKKKRSYPVDKLEQQLGYLPHSAEEDRETESCHSDDSGYDERDGMNKKRSSTSISLPELNRFIGEHELYV